ncbi:VOC family protein [Haloarchaeobius sp. DFWS5]|uniref:VOC family protein n=1 Tax=Haloarchaeobius sp. DFWS5 TaxID=3446114 RepID=UPI003EBA6AD6
MTDSTLPASTRLGRVALRVEDLDAMVAFYRDVVGLAVLDRDTAHATLGAGEEPLLELLGDTDVQPRERTEAGLYHSAFRVPSRAALGDALRRIRDGWRLDGASDHLVSEALYCTDPEGNGVEVYCDRPREAWPRHDDGSIQMATDGLDLDALLAEAGGGSQAPPATDLGHVHLEVQSLEAAQSFFVDELGFAVTVDTYPSALFVSAGGYHHHVGLNTWQGRSSPVRESSRGLAWFEVVVPDTTTLREIRDRLSGGEHLVGERDDGFEVTGAAGIHVRVRAVE